MNIIRRIGFAIQPDAAARLWITPQTVRNLVLPSFQPAFNLVSISEVKRSVAFPPVERPRGRPSSHCKKKRRESPHGADIDMIRSELLGFFGRLARGFGGWLGCRARLSGGDATTLDARLLLGLCHEALHLLLEAGAEPESTPPRTKM